jgi:hypothetical protein
MATSTLPMFMLPIDVFKFISFDILYAVIAGVVVGILLLFLKLL